MWTGPDGVVDEQGMKHHCAITELYGADSAGNELKAAGNRQIAPEKTLLISASAIKMGSWCCLDAAVAIARDCHGFQAARLATLA